MRKDHFFRVALAVLFLLAGCDIDDESAESVEGPAEAANEEAHSPDNGQWCAGHGLPESHCTKCHPELEAEYKEAGDWCEAHGFPESACPQCNPMDPPGASDAEASSEEAHSPDNGQWCAGHGLPESHCTKCHPELEAEYKEAGDWCEAHGFPESACPQCNPMEPPGASDEERAEIEGVAPGTRVVFRRSDHEETVGIEVVEARQLRVATGARAPVRLDFNQNALADVRASVPGIVRRSFVDLGDEVRAGQALFELESARVGELQSQIRGAEQDVATAQSNRERQEALHERGLAATRTVEEAQQAVERAESTLSSLRNALRVAGASDGSATTGRYTLRAPIEGQIVRRPAVIGTLATEEQSLATVADTSTMWAMMDVPERQGAALAEGQSVRLEVDALPGVEFTGEITWISPEIDRRTRSIRARAVVDNEQGRLRANQFGEAKISEAQASGGESVAVHRDALQRFGEATVVFVRVDRGTYEPRGVRPGVRQGDFVQVTGDLAVGEPVVTTGAFILKTELDPESIGAGCCEIGE